MLTLSDIAARLGAQLIGDGSMEITGVNTIDDATPQQICFLSEQRFVGKLAHSRAAAVLTEKPLADCPMAQLIVPNVQKALIAAQWLFAPAADVPRGVDPTAQIDPAAQVDPTASVGAFAVIRAGARVGPQTIIGAGCYIGQDTVIGARCRLDANVVVYQGCRIGNDCIIQANSTIGSTGFGYVFVDGQHRLIPHNGGVILEDGVEIGANSCVDRAKFGNTVIGAGTKIDNLVQVAHNVRIGRLCLLAGQVGLAGSCTLGDGVVLAGQVGVVDHIRLGNGVVAAARSEIVGDVPDGQRVWGQPAQDIAQERKCAVLYQKLPELMQELKQLKQKVAQLEAAKNNQI